MEEDDARAEGLFQVIGTDFDDRYVAKLKEQSIHPEIIKDAAKDMKIVYTPLHGTGNVPVRRVLRELGFNQVYVVKEQKCRTETSRRWLTRTRKTRKHGHWR